jgi:hypothetical protein
MMTIAISITLAYLLAGISQVTEDLTADPIDRPMWAIRPTFGKALFVGMTWIARPFLKATHSNQIARGIAFALFTVALHLTVLTGFIWCCIAVSAYFLNNTILQVVATAVLLAIGARVVMPLLNVILIPLTLIAAWPLDLLFPKKETVDVREIKWCKNCSHYKQSERYEDTFRGLWKSVSMPRNEDLPCSIVLQTSDVWENYFDLKPASRTLYPKECPHFEWR